MRKIGFWSGFSEKNDKYPDVYDFIDDNWNTEDKQRVLDWLEKHKVKNGGAMGFSVCRICGVNNGSQEFRSKEFIYPEGLIHYIRDHNIRIAELDNVIQEEN